MSYNITKTNGDPLYTDGLPENTTDSIIYKEVNPDTNELNGGGLVMIGKLIPDYGTYQSNNFVHLAENFANDARPDNPLKGMIWYNTEEGCLYVCDNDETHHWTKLLSVIFNKDEVSNPAAGDLYYDEEEKKLYIFDATKDDWIAIGPANYYGKQTDTAILETSALAPSMSYKIKGIENNSSNLVTIKAVAKENVIRTESGRPNVPETAAWIIRFLINSYDAGGSYYAKRFVGDYNVETIAKTSNAATGWNVYPVIENNELWVYTVGTSYQGTTEQNTPKISWQLDIEIVKA